MARLTGSAQRSAVGADATAERVAGDVEGLAAPLGQHADRRAAEETVTGYLKNLDRRLEEPILANSKTAIGLRQQIREFNSVIPSDEQAMEDA